jgi:hypothetical protein
LICIIIRKAILWCSKYTQALWHLRKKEYEKIVDACNSALNLEATEKGLTNGSSSDQDDKHLEMIGARLLRGTFLMLSRKHGDAMEDFDHVISDQSSPPDFR